MADFHFFPGGNFRKKLGEIEKSDPEGYRRIREVMERLLGHPEDSDGMLTGPHRGMLKKYVGRSGYRLIYKWCTSCRKLGEKVLMTCPNCAEVADNSVVFFDVFHKTDAKKLGY